MGAALPLGFDLDATEVFGEGGLFADFGWVDLELILDDGFQG